MRPTALLAFISLGLALGSVVVGHMLLVPSLTASPELIDPNLARALGEPLAMRAGEALLASCVVLAVTTPRWLRTKVGTTLALVCAGLSALDRLVLLPRLQAAWGRVDLVALRPKVRIEAAEQLQLIHDVGLAVLLVMLVVLAALGVRERDAEA